ncbi:inositol monophosphatase family protein [Vibrio sp. E150_011]
MQTISEKPTSTNITLDPPPQKKVLDRRVEIGISMIKEAGVLALSVFNDIASTDVMLKGPQDFLTEADIAVETLLRKQIRDHFPMDAIFGEEQGGEIEGDTWVLDPIDGTANFARGIPHFCIVIAFVSGDKTQFGLIYDPVHDELYQVIAGQGALLNQVPIEVASTDHFSAANLELGWSTRVPHETYMCVYEKMMSLGGNIRRSACGALALAYVACGRTDGYVELHMNPWDCLAGLLLVKEAGGVVNQYAEQEGWKNGGAVLAAVPSFATALSSSTQIRIS